MLPIGGANGSGLSLMFECLTSILAGTPIIAALSGGTGDKAVSQNATIIVFNIANFRPSAEYRSDIQQLKETVKAFPRRDGFSEVCAIGVALGMTYPPLANGIRRASLSTPGPALMKCDRSQG
jgi:LDH2 family malate/lactate/ureidoglycolate dehydrogenase